MRSLGRNPPPPGVVLRTTTAAGAARRAARAGSATGPDSPGAPLRGAQEPSAVTSGGRGPGGVAPVEGLSRAQRLFLPPARATERRFARSPASRRRPPPRWPADRGRTQRAVPVAGVAEGSVKSHSRRSHQDVDDVVRVGAEPLVVVGVQGKRGVGDGGVDLLSELAGRIGGASAASPT